MDVGTLSNAFNDISGNVQEMYNAAESFISKRKAIIFAPGGLLINGYSNIVIHEVQTEGFDAHLETTEEAIPTRQSLIQHSAPQPKRFTISGYVYDRAPAELTTTDMLGSILSTNLANVNAFLPTGMDTTTMGLYKKMEKYYHQTVGTISKYVGTTNNIINTINDLAGDGSNDISNKKTVNIPSDLLCLLDSAMPVDINIIDVLRKNVALINVRADRNTSQNNDKIYVSLDFKEIPIVVDTSEPCSFVKTQRARVSNLGRASVKKIPASESLKKKASILMTLING